MFKGAFRVIVSKMKKKHSEIQKSNKHIYDILSKEVMGFLRGKKKKKNMRHENKQGISKQAAALSCCLSDFYRGG